MSVQQGTTTRKGRTVGYYRWGNHGQMYTYPVNNPVLAAVARGKAIKQGTSVKARDRK